MDVPRLAVGEIRMHLVCGDSMLFLVT